MQFQFEMGSMVGRPKYCSVSKIASQDGNIERTIYASEAGTEVQLFIIEGGGHDWFNFTIDGMPLDVFTWEFFANAHR